VGTLDGIRIVEMAGIGPAPFAGMMLADHGAEVIRIERPGAVDVGIDVLRRSRKIVRVDLKKDTGQDVARRLIGRADGLLEGFRPGVMERLGLGPETLLANNPRLVYGRMTGWGQSGPFADAAGHDINYIALSGVLHACGRPGSKPTPPINLVGDFGGGGMMLAFGMLAALLAVQRTGKGQVIDCAMTDGSALLMSMMWSMRSNGEWSEQRGTNIIDGGAPFYDVYECADGRHIAIGSIEPQFYVELLEALELDPGLASTQLDRATWPTLRALLTHKFLTRSAGEWCTLMEGTDICFAPVLSMSEVPHHPHNRHRSTFVAVDGIMQPAPVPRFSSTPAGHPLTTDDSSEMVDTLLHEVNFDSAQIKELRNSRVVG
jgi:alpha-methylacyl-CoA racemase